MKLNVKTLKGTNFEIEASPDASVRPPLLPRPCQFNPSDSVQFSVVSLDSGAAWYGFAVAWCSDCAGGPVVVRGL
jgi:hypothetical protein